MENQTIQSFYRIGPPPPKKKKKKIAPLFLIRGNFTKRRKALLNHVECIEISRMTKNLGL